MSDHVKPHQIVQQKRQAQLRQDRARADRQRWQEELAAALQHGASLATADELLHRLVETARDGSSYDNRDAIAFIVGTAALVLDGALERARDWGGKHFEAALRAELRRRFAARPRRF
jgi:hypothetical protein